MTDKPTLPVVYSCSGASSAAQMANHMAVALDRRGVAEMSCIAGVGGDVPSLVRVATDAQRTGRPIVAIDGCALACAKHSLARHGVEPTVHHQLQHHAVRKRMGQDYDPDEAESILQEVIVPTVPTPAMVGPSVPGPAVPAPSAPGPVGGTDAPTAGPGDGSPRA